MTAELPPPRLMEELVEEILLRLPPQEPVSLVRAALVSKPWCRLVSSLRFRRRFRDFHGAAPILGFLCNGQNRKGASLFVPTAAAASPLRASRFDLFALDARHGRVLLREPTKNVLTVWDPVTNVRRELPVPPRRASRCTAAVLCAEAALDDDHDHDHDEYCRSFLVVFVGADPYEMFVCTYSSDADAWSDPIAAPHPTDCYVYAGYSPSLLLGNKLYLGIPGSNMALEYDLELRHRVSWIQLPVPYYWTQRSVLMAAEDGELGLVTMAGGCLRVWLRMDVVDAAAAAANNNNNNKANDDGWTNAGWVQIKSIGLGRLLPAVKSVFFEEACVIGYADGLGIAFLMLNSSLYTIDLNTSEVKEVYKGATFGAVFPYMSFCFPALEAVYLSEEPSAGGSSAW